MLAIVTKACPCGKRFALRLVYQGPRRARFCSKRCCGHLGRVERRKRQKKQKAAHGEKRCAFTFCDRIVSAGRYWRTGRRIYCSLVCRCKARNQRITPELAEADTACERCGKPLDLVKRRQGISYCSRRCYSRDRNFWLRRAKRAAVFRTPVDALKRALEPGRALDPEIAAERRAALAERTA